MIAEESSTLEKYGDSYRVYKERTPRWLGLPKSDKKPGIGEND
jgi:protein-S-isoprenylcysteine O-methyltransferase Ste14